MATPADPFAPSPLAARPNLRGGGGPGGDVSRLRRLRARWHHALTRPSPVRLIALGYLGYMALGWALLALPFAAAAPVAPLAHLFMAVSAVSTTGLVTVDPGGSYTLFGEAVLLLLIQAGGLGFMTLGSVAWAALSGSAGPLRERVARSVLPGPAGLDVRRFLRRVVVYSLAVEAAGAAALYALLPPTDAPGGVPWSAAFHSVSAFCTAGFSLHATSFEPFAGDPAVLLAVAALSLLGAMGFLVASELWDRARGRLPRLSSSTRLILGVTAALVAGGTAFLAAAEPSLAAMPPGARLLNAFFQSMTAATTVGFNSVPIGALAPASVVVMYALMLVGASPSGTGGGLKSTTVAVLAALVSATARGREAVTLFGRPVPPARVRQAASTLAVALALLGAAMLALSLTDPGQPFGALLFEAISALGTVGLSLGITGALSEGGKLVVVALMAAGRIGVLSLAVALAWHERARAEAAEAEDVVL